MATILCLETATTNCSVALSVDGEVIGLREVNNYKYTHSEKLHVFIEELMKENSVAMTQLSAVAVSKGPGSYTGLRIGVSAAKGLSFALGIPLIAIPTLQSLANQISCSDCFIVPMIDARRMEVYAAVYDATYNKVRETRAEILTEDSFSSFLSEGKTVFLGDGASKFKDICQHKNAHFLEDRFPSAADMARLAEDKYKISDIEDVAYFEPYYFKEFKSN